MTIIVLPNSQVEHVALAIEKTMFAPHEFPLSPDLHQKYLVTAKAAIQAMRDWRIANGG